MVRIANQLNLSCLRLGCGGTGVSGAIAFIDAALRAFDMKRRRDVTTPRALLDVPLKEGRRLHAAIRALPIGTLKRHTSPIRKTSRCFVEAEACLIRLVFAGSSSSPSVELQELFCGQPKFMRLVCHFPCCKNMCLCVSVHVCVCCEVVVGPSRPGIGKSSLVNFGSLQGLRGPFKIVAPSPASQR